MPLGEWFRKVTGLSISTLNTERQTAPVETTLIDLNDPEKAARNQLDPGYYITLHPITGTEQQLKDPLNLRPYSAQLVQTLMEAGLISSHVIQVGGISLGQPCSFSPVAYQQETQRLLVRVRLSNQSE